MAYKFHHPSGSATSTIAWAARRIFASSSALLTAASSCAFTSMAAMRVRSLSEATVIEDRSVVVILRFPFYDDWSTVTPRVTFGRLAEGALLNPSPFRPFMNNKRESCHFSGIASPRVIVTVPVTVGVVGQYIEI